MLLQVFCSSFPDDWNILIFFCVDSVPGLDVRGEGGLGSYGEEVREPVLQDGCDWSKEGSDYLISVELAGRLLDGGFPAEGIVPCWVGPRVEDWLKVDMGASLIECLVDTRELALVFIRNAFRIINNSIISIILFNLQ